MKKLILSLLTSKKFVVSMSAVVTVLLVKLGLPEVTAGELAVLITPFVGYAIAQGAGGDRKDAQREAFEYQREEYQQNRIDQLEDEARRDAALKEHGSR